MGNEHAPRGVPDGRTLAGRTIVMSGGSRGIGLAILAEAAILVLTGSPGERTGQTLIDAEVLAEAGVSDLSPYGGGDSPVLDLYIDPPDGSEPSILAPRQGDSHV